MEKYFPETKDFEATKSLSYIPNKDDDNEEKEDDDDEDDDDDENNSINNTNNGGDNISSPIDNISSIALENSIHSCANLEREEIHGSDVLNAAPNNKIVNTISNLPCADDNVEGATAAPPRPDAVVTDLQPNLAKILSGKDGYLLAPRQSFPNSQTTVNHAQQLVPRQTGLRYYSNNGVAEKEDTCTERDDYEDNNQYKNAILKARHGATEDAGPAMPEETQQAVIGNETDVHDDNLFKNATEHARGATEDAEPAMPEETQQANIGNETDVHDDNLFKNATENAHGATENAGPAMPEKTQHANIGNETDVLDDNLFENATEYARGVTEEAELVMPEETQQANIGNETDFLDDNLYKNATENAHGATDDVELALSEEAHQAVDCQQQTSEKTLISRDIAYTELQAGVNFHPSPQRSDIPPYPASSDADQHLEPALLPTAQADGRPDRPDTTTEGLSGDPVFHVHQISSALSVRQVYFHRPPNPPAYCDYSSAVVDLSTGIESLSDDDIDLTEHRAALLPFNRRRIVGGSDVQLRGSISHPSVPAAVVSRSGAMDDHNHVLTTSDLVTLVRVSRGMLGRGGRAAQPPAPECLRCRGRAASSFLFPCLCQSLCDGCASATVRDNGSCPACHQPAQFFGYDTGM